MPRRSLPTPEARVSTAVPQRMERRAAGRRLHCAALETSPVADPCSEACPATAPSHRPTRQAVSASDAHQFNPSPPQRSGPARQRPNPAVEIRKEMQSGDGARWQAPRRDLLLPRAQQETASSPQADPNPRAELEGILEPAPLPPAKCSAGERTPLCQRGRQSSGWQPRQDLFLAEETVYGKGV